MATTAISWDLPEEAWEAAHEAATSVARRFSGVTEYDDLYQDALVYMAERPDLVRRRLKDGGKGYLRLRLRDMLADRCKTLAGRAALNINIDDEIGGGRL